MGCAIWGQSGNPWKNRRKAELAPAPPSSLTIIWTALLWKALSYQPAWGAPNLASTRNKNLLEKIQVVGSGLGLLESGGSNERLWEECETVREGRNCTGADTVREKRKIKWPEFSMRSSILSYLLCNVFHFAVLLLSLKLCLPSFFLPPLYHSTSSLDFILAYYSPGCTTLLNSAGEHWLTWSYWQDIMLSFAVGGK